VSEQLPVPTTQSVVGAALLQLHRQQTLENAYDAWLELRLAHAGFVARGAQERRKLEQQGAFLVGAVRAAAEQPPGPQKTLPDALMAPGADPLEGFLHQAQHKLGAARSQLEAELGAQQALYQEAFEKIRAELQARVERTARQVRPALLLRLRSLAQGRTVLHLDRVRPDEAVLLLHALTGRIPSRYGFLFDDATDDAQSAPPTLYAEEGVEAERTRPSPSALRELVDAGAPILPVKGHIPILVPRAQGGALLFRLLQRGPVMEVEIEDGPAFRGLLTRQEGEQFAGHLLRCKLQGLVDLEVLAD
jgi:hypothetical protein